MTTPAAEPLPARHALDPNSPRGIEATRKAAVIAAAVLDRLEREGIEVPPVASRNTA